MKAYIVREKYDVKTGERLSRVEKRIPTWRAEELGLKKDCPMDCIGYAMCIKNGIEIDDFIVRVD